MLRQEKKKKNISQIHEKKPNQISLDSVNIAALIQIAYSKTQKYLLCSVSKSLNWIDWNRQMFL